MIEDLIQYIPISLRDRSGTVFYSGRNAFSSLSKLYVLRLNPGGSPLKQASETVGWHPDKVLHEKPNDWSEYKDEPWLGKPAGSHGLQPCVLHLFNFLDLNPRHVPSSNLIFLRSENERDLNVKQLAPECGSFHQKVIEKPGVRVVLCFGNTVGGWVRCQLEADRLVDEFIEKNNRKWSNSVYENQDGFSVVIAKHPSRVDWKNPATDSSPLLQSALNRAE